MDADEARRELYEVMKLDREFEWKAERALELGERYLGVDNGHLTRIHPESDFWKAIVSTDPPDGAFPADVVLDLQVSFCRYVVDRGDSVAIHDAARSEIVDDEDPGLHCYHGTPVTVDGDLYGTVCFVSEDPRGEPFGEEETIFAELIARMLEHELQRQRTAEKIERLERFASVLSHDIRNPLNVAAGRLDMARRADDTEHLDSALEALVRIDDLISDVLTMARQGWTVEDLEPVRLGSLVEGCWRSVDTADAAVSLAGDLTFLADPGRVKHVFENLLRNAIEHGGEAVSVGVGPLEGGDGFYVEDDGPGIPRRKRESVFETGYTTGSGGVGLGLAIVDGVVSAHGWRVTVTEGSDGGARFEVRDVDVVDPAPG